MKQPIMKCMYSSEQLKEQMELLEYISALQTQLSASDELLRECLERLAETNKCIIEEKDFLPITRRLNEKVIEKLKATLAQAERMEP